MKQRYDSYKPSGIDWIGEIPSHWETLTLKQVSSSIRNGYVGPTKDILVDFGVPYIQSLHVKDGKICFERGEYYVTSLWGSKHPKIFTNDIVIVQTGDIGQVAIIPEEYNGCNCHALIIVVADYKKIVPSYLSYYLRSDVGKELMLLTKTGATLPHLNSGSICNTQVVLPSIAEQYAMVGWLDEKCSEIDAAIEKVEREIELIDELKQSEISRVVTRGLNPDVALKSSGIDWIGEIPCHWDCVKTLFALSMPITDGPHETPALYEDGIPFISAEAISTGKIRFDHMRGYISQAYYEECCKKYIPQRNDIYMTKSGASTGRVALVETDCIFTIWSPLAVFRANASKTDYKFLYYVLLSECYQKQVENGWSYGTQQNIGMRTLEKLKIPLPPLTEQQSISDYLDKKCAEIDGLKEKLVRKRETLKELRQSIISEVVTGKRKVI